MSRIVTRFVLTASLTAFASLAPLAGCGPSETQSGNEAPPEAAGALAEQARALFGTLPAEVPNPANEMTESKIELGRMLYYEPRLSKSQEISCNSCHRLDRFGVDNEPTSPGHAGQRGDRNSPTTLNAALHLAQFWDGRAADVEEQAVGPVMNPVEMAMPSEAQVAVVLSSMPAYVDLFEAAFPDDPQPVRLANVGLAIAAFERRLLTPSRLDLFASGDLDALSEEEQRGLRLFIETGCTACHAGPAIGGGMYQKLGLVQVYETEDHGRFKVTGAEADRFVFKVPSLRNVAETGPWFHDGSVTTLDDAVRKMAWHQLGRKLDDADVQDLIAFLGSLTGEVDADYTAEPTLPPSSALTPGPAI